MALHFSICFTQYSQMTRDREKERENERAKAMDGRKDKMKKMRLEKHIQQRQQPNNNKKKSTNNTKFARKLFIRLMSKEPNVY